MLLLINTFISIPRPRECWSWKEIVWSTFYITFVGSLPRKSRSPCNHLICHCLWFDSYNFAHTCMPKFTRVQRVFVFFFSRFGVCSCFYKNPSRVDLSVHGRYQNAEWRLRPLPDEMIRWIHILEILSFVFQTCHSEHILVSWATISCNQWTSVLVNSD